jgi:hypothetical protein
MALDFKKRREMLRTLAIDIDGDTLTIKYRPARFTPGKVRELAETGAKAKAALTEARSKAADAAPETQTEDPELAAALAELDAQISAIGGLAETTTDRFLDAVAEWDATNDGEPVELTREGLEAADVDLNLMSFVLAKIQEDQNVSPPSAPNSGKRS